MLILETLELEAEQAKAILDLWNQEYPEQLRHTELEGFYQHLGALKQKKHYLLIETGNEIKGWGFLFKRENENWFALILDSMIQGKGHGTQLLNRIQAGEECLSGWVIDHNRERKGNGEPYKSPLHFYLKNGFKIASEQRLETDRISAVKISWQRK